MNKTKLKKITIRVINNNKKDTEDTTINKDVKEFILKH